MKNIFFLMLMLASATPSFSQNNIGIGTTTPNASAILDITSTNKGLLIPRVTTAQRTTIISPVIGLLVFDTDTKTLWAYDGNAWKDLSSNGGSGNFSLPFSQTINTATSALLITNQGTAAAIEGASTNELGIGITAKTTGEYGWGLLAFSNRPGAKAINAFADSGTVFNGENQFTGNTNTLMSLTNRGLGKTASVQLNNNSNTAANMQIAGNHLGEQLLIYQTNALNSKPSVSVNNSGTGAGIDIASNSGGAIIAASTGGIGVSGSSNTNYGIKGVTNTATGFAGVLGENTGTAGSGVIGRSDAANTQGVYAISANGIGMRASSTSYRAVQATSTTGTALYGSSTSSYALETNGNIKIAGGNTNPAAGAVLTSDASGNATWQSLNQTPDIGFRCYGISTTETSGTANNEIPHNQYKKVEFQTESYDAHNDFIPTGSSAAVPTSSTFLAPINGIYHFDATVRLEPAVLFDYISLSVRLVLQRGQNITVIAENNYFVDNNYTIPSSISTDQYLLANDVVWLEFKHTNYSFTASDLETAGIENYFSGHLLFKR